MHEDTAVWFESFSSKPFSVIPLHIIVVAGTLLTLFFGAHSIEKTNKIMMPLFFIIFLILAVRVAMLRVQRKDISSCSHRTGQSLLIL